MPKVPKVEMLKNRTKKKPLGCKSAMGKPPSKASEGGRFDIFYVIGGVHFW